MNEMLASMGRRDIGRFLRHLWVSKYGDLKNDSLFSAIKSNISKQSISSVDFVRAFAGECQNYVAL
jgi:hypothetical protein